MLAIRCFSRSTNPFTWDNGSCRRPARKRLLPYRKKWARTNLRGDGPCRRLRRFGETRYPEKRAERVIAVGVRFLPMLVPDAQRTDADAPA